MMKLQNGSLVDFPCAMPACQAVTMLLCGGLRSAALGARDLGYNMLAIDKIMEMQHPRVSTFPPTHAKERIHRHQNS